MESYGKLIRKYLFPKMALKESTHTAEKSCRNIRKLLPREITNRKVGAQRVKRHRYIMVANSHLSWV